MQKLKWNGGGRRRIRSTGWEDFLVLSRDQAAHKQESGNQSVAGQTCVSRFQFSRFQFFYPSSQTVIETGIITSHEWFYSIRKVG